MVSNGLIYVLLVLGGVSLGIAVASLVMLSLVLKKQKEVLHICTTKLVNTQVTVAQQRNNAGFSDVPDKIDNNPKHGKIICKKCYAAISDATTVCSFCKIPVGRR